MPDRHREQPPVPVEVQQVRPELLADPERAVVHACDRLDVIAGPTASTGARSVRPGGDGPGGIFLMDPETFELKGPWEKDRGPQQLAYDFWWHLGHDTIITSEWGTPNMVKDGVNPELLLGGKYGHKLHVWDLDTRRHVQEIDLGAEQQMVLELRPAHDPKKAYGFVGVVRVAQGPVVVDLDVVSRRRGTGQGRQVGGSQGD